jgi:hypothetical protein
LYVSLFITKFQHALTCQFYPQSSFDLSRQARQSQHNTHALPLAQYAAQVFLFFKCGLVFSTKNLRHRAPLGKLFADALVAGLSPEARDYFGEKFPPPSFQHLLGLFASSPVASTSTSASLPACLLFYFFLDADTDNTVRMLV